MRWKLGLLPVVAGLFGLACNEKSSNGVEGATRAAASAALPLTPCGSGPATSAAALANGGFEGPGLLEPGYLSIAPNTPPDGFAWAVFADGADVCRAGWGAGGITVSGAPYEGKQYLDLVGYGSTGKIAQTVAVTPGEAHTLRFAYANNPLSTHNAAARIKVYDCREVLLSKTFTHDTSTAEDLGWTIFEARVSPKTSPVTIEIESTYAEGSGGILLDGITLTH